MRSRGSKNVPVEAQVSIVAADMKFCKSLLYPSNFQNEMRTYYVGHANIPADGTNVLLEVHQTV